MSDQTRMDGYEGLSHGAQRPAGVDQWFEAGAVRFYWRAGALEVYALKRGKPAGRPIVSLPRGAAEGFREWLCTLVDVSQ